MLHFLFVSIYLDKEDVIKVNLGDSMLWTFSDWLRVQVCCYSFFYEKKYQVLYTISRVIILSEFSAYL